MSNSKEDFQKDYSQYGFVTDIEEDRLPPGLDESTVRFISGRKGEPEWMLEFRLKAFRTWKKMKEPRWAHVEFPKIDFESISYYSAPKQVLARKC
jgi:Fe-S cluster assembly protein SufB